MIIDEQKPVSTIEITLDDMHALRDASMAWVPIEDVTPLSHRLFHEAKDGVASLLWWQPQPTYADFLAFCADHLMLVAVDTASRALMGAAWLEDKQDGTVHLSGLALPPFRGKRTSAGLRTLVRWAHRRWQWVWCVTPWQRAKKAALAAGGLLVDTYDHVETGKTLFVVSWERP